MWRYLWKREEVMIRTLLLAEFEPELLQGSSRERLCLSIYDVFYRIDYAVLWSLRESMQQDLSCCSSPASYFQENGLLFDRFSCVCEAVWISAAPWPCLNTHKHVQNPHKHTFGCREILHWSFSAVFPKFLSVCEMDKDREKQIEEADGRTSRIYRLSLNAWEKEMLRRDVRFMLWTLPSQVCNDPTSIIRCSVSKRLWKWLLVLHECWKDVRVRTYLTFNAAC